MPTAAMKRLWILCCTHILVLLWKEKASAAVLLLLSQLPRPQAPIHTLQFQLYCCYQLLHAASLMSPPQLISPSLQHSSIFNLLDKSKFFYYCFFIFFALLPVQGGLIFIVSNLFALCSLACL